MVIDNPLRLLELRVKRQRISPEIHDTPSSGPGEDLRPQEAAHTVEDEALRLHSPPEATPRRNTIQIIVGDTMLVPLESGLLAYSKLMPF